MDVTCERCGTEYEFDETLLSGRGTSVKCTNCGYVFKVYPKDRSGADPAANDWRLKLENGAIDIIDSLRELQRRISAGELTPDDEISRGQEGWKTLGSIPELETFFQAAGIQIPGRGIPSPLPPSPTAATSTDKVPDSTLGRRPRQPTLLGVAPMPKMEPMEARGGTGSVPEPTPAPVSDPASETEPVSASTQARASGTAPQAKSESAYESPYSSDSVPPDVLPSSPSPTEIEDAEFEERPRNAARVSGRLSAPPPPYYDDDDDIPDLPGQSSSPLRWLLLLVVVGALALIGTQWARVAALLGLGANTAQIAAGVAEGDAGLAEGDLGGYASAIEGYGHAIAAGGDRDPEILSKLSNAYALSAQAQIDDGVATESTAKLAATALELARSAVEIDPQDLEALLAEADALRLINDYSEARRVLDTAREMAFSRTAELYRIDARLSAAEAGGGLEHGLRSARQSVELAPHGVPYLLLLARAEHAADQDPSARVALETILADHPDHPVATKLLAELTVPAAAIDAGVTDDAGLPSEAAPVSAPVPPPVPAAAPARTPKPAVAPTTAARPAPNPKPVVEPPPRKRSAAKKRAAPKSPAIDEYDQLAKAAGDDAFVDGRPPVRDYEWYMRQGEAELAGGNYSRARAFFDSALEARPGSADAMDGLGRVLTRIEDYESALRYFRAAAQRGQADGYFNLGKTYERLGQKDEAVSAYYTYLMRHPSGPHATAAKSAIQTLEPRAKLPEEPEPPPAEDQAQQPEAEPVPGPATP
jgi:predicted Zn finger-like uncharacterized protein